MSPFNVQSRLQVDSMNPIDIQWTLSNWYQTIHCFYIIFYIILLMMLRRFDKICWDFRTISSWILESLQWRRILVRSSSALIFETNPELWCWERWPDHVTGIPLIVDERFLHNFSWKLIYEILKTVLLIRNRFSSNHLGVSTTSNGVFSYVGDYYQIDSINTWGYVKAISYVNAATDGENRILMQFHRSLAGVTKWISSLEDHLLVIEKAQQWGLR